MLILGLNAYHGDSAACIVRNGEILAAAEEERFRRIKHWAGFPVEAIRYCLHEAGVDIDGIDILAINSDPRANVLKKIAYTFLGRPDPSFLIGRLRNQQRRMSIEDDLAEAFPDSTFKGRVCRVEHHLAHLASAFLVSPFAEAVAVSVDGFGDFSSTAWGVGRGKTICVDGRVHFPHSLGIFYQAITQFIGFPNYGDEYKVMGLAPYGAPTYLDAMRRIIRLTSDGDFRLEEAYFRHHRNTNITNVSEASGGTPVVDTLYDLVAFEDLLGPRRASDDPLEQRHRDIARSAQQMYEEAFFHLLHRLHDRYQLDSLTLAGGCAMNSVANGKIIRQTPYKRLYVQSAAGDAGGAIGAAIYAMYQSQGSKSMVGSNLLKRSSVLAGDMLSGRSIMEHAYLGPSARDEDIVNLLKEKDVYIRERGCVIEHISDETELCRYTAEAIARGEVVGWFQGRMEWGPRALGNRSIICDPRRSDMQDILNLKIKRRESFRPFAPSVLKEHVSEWFEEDGDVPFMMQVYQIREGKRGLIPAVTHVDGSGRLQTVYRETNNRYWKLIDSFYQISGVPMVLNTSFNENEPVVCRPIEALDCFLRTKMDLLIIGNYIIVRGN